MALFGIFSRREGPELKAQRTRDLVLGLLERPDKRMYHLEFALEKGLKQTGRPPGAGAEGLRSELSLLLAVVYLQYAQRYFGLALDLERIQPSWKGFAAKAKSCALQAAGGGFDQLVRAIEERADEIGAVTQQQAQQRGLLTVIERPVKTGVPGVPVYEIVREGWTLAEKHAQLKLCQQPMCDFVAFFKALPGHVGWAEKHPEAS